MNTPENMPPRRPLRRFTDRYGDVVVITTTGMRFTVSGRNT